MENVFRWQLHWICGATETDTASIRNASRRSSTEFVELLKQVLCQTGLVTGRSSTEFVELLKRGVYVPLVGVCRSSTEFVELLKR